MTVRVLNLASGIPSRACKEATEEDSKSLKLCMEVIVDHAVNGED